MSSDQQRPTGYDQAPHTTDTPAVQATSLLQRGLLAAAQQYERDFAAENSSPTVAALHALAQGYDRANTDAHREALAAEVVEDISLAEAGTLRRAAEALKLGIPGIISRETIRGLRPAAIAKELGVTESYVRRIVREKAVEAYEQGIIAGRALLAAETGASGLSGSPEKLSDAGRGIVDATREALETEMARHEKEAAAARNKTARAAAKKRNTHPTD